MLNHIRTGRSRKTSQQCSHALKAYSGCKYGCNGRTTRASEMGACLIVNTVSHLQLVIQPHEVIMHETREDGEREKQMNYN